MIWEAGTIEELGIGEGPYRVYRSGRHKNDMPGVFTLGGRDESLEDVLGAMTENGDKTNAGDNLYRVISDHLTIVQGSERSIVVEYMGGRKQLCETTIILDEQYGLKKIEAKVEFNHYLSPNGQLESEGWEVTLGEWEPNGKFPIPMKQVAEEIEAA